MLFSIITINYNNKKGLENTIKSVIDQTFKDFEFILIDGDSIDGSKDILEKYNHYFAYFVSEPDTGIYNAMNKSISKSKGEYLLFLNSGDIFHNDEVLSNIEPNIFENYDIYYGNEVFLNGKVIPIPNHLSLGYLFESSIRHQATFIKRDLFDRVFFYNEKLKIVSDWEFIICAIYKYGASYKYVDLIISEYEGNGISQIPDNLKLRSLERKMVLKKHFPIIYDDYMELIRLRTLFKNRRVRRLINFENSIFIKKIKSRLHRYIAKIFLS